MHGGAREDRTQQACRETLAVSTCQCGTEAHDFFFSFNTIIYCI